MNIMIRAYQTSDLPDMIRIWNEVVEEGAAFPQEDFLNEQTGSAFFAEHLVVFGVHLVFRHTVRTLIQYLVKSLGTLLVADLDTVFTLPFKIVIVEQILNLFADFLRSCLFQLLGGVGKCHIRLNGMHPTLSVVAPERIIDMMSSAGQSYNRHTLVLYKLTDRIGIVLPDKLDD